MRDDNGHGIHGRTRKKENHSLLMVWSHPISSEIHILLFRGFRGHYL